MAIPIVEKRKSRRVSLNVPARVRTDRVAGGELETATRDVSRSGIYFYSDIGMPEGSEIEIVAMLPSEITHMPGTSWVCCHARVVRVDADQGGIRGVAAEIEKFALLPEL